MLSETEFLTGTLSLFFSKKEHAGLKVGTPAVFLDFGKSAVLFEEVTLFLRTCFVTSSSTTSPNSWAKAAYASKGWLTFLQHLKIDWKAATHQDLIAFRDAFLESISPQTLEPYDAKGIGDAVTTIKRLYEFCFEKKWYSGDVRAFQSIGKSSGRQNIATENAVDYYTPLGEQDPDLPKVPKGEAISTIRHRNLERLAHHLGPRASEREGDLRATRNRLVLDLGWVVGLRVAEVVSLTDLQFLNLNPDPKSPFANLRISVLGKGKKRRNVLIPTWLVFDVLAYIDGERADALKKLKQKKLRAASTALLIAGKDSRRCGLPIGTDAIQKVIREACLAIGLVETIEGINPLTGQPILKTVSLHSFHDLRHTYAVYTYHVERALGNPEPWKKIQAQLGHEHLNTTKDTYLKEVEQFDDMPGMPTMKMLRGD